jgi:hypothetical protein
MSSHDSLRFVSGLGAKLATRSRHVCTLFGAGSSRACGLPDIVMLQERVLKRLGESQCEQFTRQLEGRNLEQALSRLRRITALLEKDQTLDGLTAQKSYSLDLAICKAIIAEVSIENADLTPTLQLAAWLARANYHSPVEIFTVNYDLLIETALESLRVPYFDGFLGNLRAHFQTELVEALPESEHEQIPAFFVRLWKLHGSVNWAWESPSQIVRLGHAVTEGMAAAIYPSDTKYEESRRVPFLVLQDRMRRALHQTETLALVAGYSFGDSHLNEMLFDAAARRQRTEIVVFCYSTIPDVLAERAASTPNIQVLGDREAIIGGIRGNWEIPDNDAVGIFEQKRFLLGDFKKLAAYLAKSTSRLTDSGTQLHQLINTIAGDSNSDNGA